MEMRVKEAEERERNRNQGSNMATGGDNSAHFVMAQMDRFSRPILPERWLSEEELIALLSRYTDWPIYEARMVVVAESGGNANAQSDTNDDGLAQIHAGYWKYGMAIYDPPQNIGLMHWKYVNNGYTWQGWNAVKGVLW